MCNSDAFITDSVSPSSSFPLQPGPRLTGVLLNLADRQRGRPGPGIVGDDPLLGRRDLRELLTIYNLQLACFGLAEG